MFPQAEDAWQEFQTIRLGTCFDTYLPWKRWNRKEGIQKKLCHSLLAEGIKE